MPLPEEWSLISHTLAATASCCLAQGNSFTLGAPSQGVQMVGPDLLESSCWWGQYKCMRESNSRRSFLWELSGAHPQCHDNSSDGLEGGIWRSCFSRRKCTHHTPWDKSGTSSEVTASVLWAAKYGRYIFTTKESCLGIVLRRGTSYMPLCGAQKDPGTVERIWGWLPWTQIPALPLWESTSSSLKFSFLICKCR